MVRLRKTGSFWLGLTGQGRSSYFLLFGDEELLLPSGVPARPLALGWPGIPATCLTAVFPAFSEARFLSLDTGISQPPLFQVSSSAEEKTTPAVL
jgi:hypothetical protein